MRTARNTAGPRARTVLTASDIKRDAYYKRVYGIGLADYDKLFAEQGGCCGVCRRPATAFKSRLAVDHDHHTGEIRGLLCTFCNRRVIGHHRDPNLFEAAAHYLRKGTGWFVPAKKPRRKKRRR